MKRTFTVLSACALVLSLILAVCIDSGCSTDTVTKAVNADAVTITAVNAAMTTFASYANAGKATPTQITTVSNAYAAYYNAQIVASNAAMLYVQAPSTNLATAETLAIATALASESNIVAIVNAFTAK